MEPLVSVIIGNFNYARFLRAAIDSALAQTYPRTEVIAVDDGSTDDSRQVIASYGDRIASVLKREGGHASVLNAGFRASRGAIVMFLDSDDMLLPEAAAEVVRAWRSDTAKVQFVLEQVDAGGRRLGITVPYLPAEMPEGDLRDKILRDGGYVTPPTSGSAFARPVLERLLPLREPEWFQAANTPIEILAPFFGQVVSIKKPLGLYRVHDANYGMLGGPLAARKLRSKLVTDLQREYTLCEFARRAGLNPAGNWTAHDLGNLKYRLASLRTDPGFHPFLDDRRLVLMARGVAESWRTPRYSIRGRLFNTAWFPLVAILPMALARPLIRMGLLPRRKRRNGGAGTAP
ncbi:MAG: glycosyltransferase family 2 protein [Candidatus Binataceae bacterium]